MNAEEVRAYLLKLPHVEETMQWGANLVFRVGDKRIGGKMFALLNLDGDGKAVISFAAGPERYRELLEVEGVIPAPYLARAYWVALEGWGVLGRRELEDLLSAACRLIYEKLPRRSKDLLALSLTARKRILRDRKKQLAQQAAVRPGRVRSGKK